MHVRQEVASFSGFTLVLRPIQTASARRPSARCRLPDTVFQTALWQTASGRHSVWHHGVRQTASARRYQADGVCQTPSARHCFCQTPSARCRLRDTVCQTPRLADAVSARQSGIEPSGRRHLADAECQTLCVPDAVCQTALCQTVWQTRRLADTSARLSGIRGIWQTPSVADTVSDR